MNKTISERYRNNLTLAENELTYRLSGGRHVVTLHMHCGEDVAPDVWRFEKVEDARSQWRHLRNDLARRSYVKV